jgi:hypothetical protein
VVREMMEGMWVQYTRLKSGKDKDEVVRKKDSAPTKEKATMGRWYNA